MNVDVPGLTQSLMALRREEGDVVLEDLISDPLTEEELANLWLYLSEWKTAAALLEKVVNQALSRRMEQNGRGITVGEMLVFYSVRKTERCIDTNGFHKWLAHEVRDTPEILERLFNPNTVRKGALPKGVRETFFEKSADPQAEKSLAAVPKQVLEDNKTRKALADG